MLYSINIISVLIWATMQENLSLGAWKSEIQTSLLGYKD